MPNLSVRKKIKQMLTTMKSVYDQVLLHICLVIFISLISYTKLHLLISCTKVQLIHFAIHFHLTNFTDHRPSHSHSLYLVFLILHRISTSLPLSFLSQSPLYKVGVSLNKVLIRNICYIIWNWTTMVLLATS